LLPPTAAKKAALESVAQPATVASAGIPYLEATRVLTRPMTSPGEIT
jgi:hypothetical protein